jgi:glycosyltransferase involved in cell wall biosynthesis
VGEESYQLRRLPVSVLILTLDEAANLGDCLASVSWCDDVVVLDSFSTDATVQLGASMGARVQQRAFDNYAAQRNFGLQEIQYRNPWVLMLDADERMTAELREELERVLAETPDEVALYLVRRRDHLFGRWIKRCSGYPTWFGRVARLGKVWVERPINEEFHTSGSTQRLQGHLDHYPFNKGFAAWIDKHNRYSTMEASLMFEGGRRASLRGLFSKDQLEKRKHLKAFVYALPGRPLIMFVALYVLKGGFLDGRAGLTYSLLRAWYEYMIDCKYGELKRRRERSTV